jgi:predicted nucleotidyltransferase
VDCHEIKSKLQENQAELSRMKKTQLSLFGSSVRGEAASGSNVDLIVEFDGPVGLFHFFRVQHRLEEILGVDKVDLVQRGALHPELKDGILAQARHVA